MQDKIEQDIKSALLSGDKQKVEVLRGLKNAILYETVAQNARQTGLSEEQIQKVLAREVKKRNEAAELYKKVGETSRAQAELSEKSIIESYLPAQATEAEVSNVVNEEIAKFAAPSPGDMGKIIGIVRGRLGPVADGATIARLVKQALEAK